MSAAGDRARARIRRNRFEGYFWVLSGALGPVRRVDDDLASDEEAAGELGLLRSPIPPDTESTDDVDPFDDRRVINPPTDASWVSDRNRPVPLFHPNQSR